MGYYTRVLSRRADCPTLEELRAPLRVVYPDVKLTTDQPQSQSESKAPEWADLVLRHDDGLEIAAIERNMVEPGSLGAEEIAEFIDAIADGEPASAASWLTSYLPHVRAIYAFQHLAGTRERRGDEALQAATLGGANALRRDDLGRLAPGARADAVMLDAASYMDLVYRPGVPLVSACFVAGSEAWESPPPE